MSKSYKHNQDNVQNSKQVKLSARMQDRKVKQEQRCTSAGTGAKQDKE